MSEPGRFHASSGASLRDMTETGVLENSIIVEDLAILAQACGFTDVKVVPLTLQNSLEVPAKGLNTFLAGEPIRRLLDEAEGQPHQFKSSPLLQREVHPRHEAAWPSRDYSILS